MSQTYTQPATARITASAGALKTAEYWPAKRQPPRRSLAKRAVIGKNSAKSMHKTYWMATPNMLQYPQMEDWRPSVQAP